MYSNGRHTLVSVVATVAMVVMTVLLAAWFPGQPAAPEPQPAALIGIAPGR
ncbi:hypothetical protein FHX42_003235 [Saccharopolyspora lacisalsi]|uniref:Uncharacterized protein n=1 Tax=Halosaccharopolyspora lacisalsi TaxID=1000566 RepID=A0A839DYR7_9PSEU|nr:hypothetical protein [Halosaccharopolyspora lacisalsi]